MKKKLFLALLTTLLLLLAASAALAASPSDYTCTECGNPCTSWLSMEASTYSYHVPFCNSCGIDLYEFELLCTPVEGTADCVGGNRCSDCGAPDDFSSSADPNAHNWRYFYANDLTHIRECYNWCGASGSAPHFGGDDSCMPVCEGCLSSYPADGEHRNMTEWDSSNAQQHSRKCTDCWTFEYGDHTGGTATCASKPICEVCGKSYGDLSTHTNMSDWVSLSSTQHYRYCLDCYEYEYAPHTGGTATCSTQAVCEGCGASYGELSDKHLNMSDWFYVNAEQHLRYCRDCVSSDSYEYEDHYGGDGSCRPTCEGCGDRYYDADGEHRSMSDWAPVDGTEHYRFCLDCSTSDSIEYGDHYGGTATCTQRAVCEGCGTEYGALSDVHPWGEWKSYDSSGHRRYCTNPDCDASEYANHSGSGDSCLIECEDCGDLYINAEGQHLTMSVWYRLNDTQHMRHCVDCGYGEQYEDHTGGKATCTEQAVCEVCSEGYGEKDPNNHVNMSDWHTSDASQHSRYCLDCAYPDRYEYEDHYGGTATCTQEAVCEGCGGSYGELSDEHLNMSDWQDSDASQHRRYCLDCASPDSYEYEDHYGGTASCRKYAVCEGCGESYGEYDPNNHARMSDWWFRDASQHRRYCLDCASSDSYEYGDHYGGDGSCFPICEGCGERYYDADGEHRSMSDWACFDDTQHYRYCLDCPASNSIELAPHTGGTATCTELAVCEVCSTKYGVTSDVHPWGEWEPYDSYGHLRRCTNPDCNASDYAIHSGGDGSCRTECEDCGEIYTDEDGKHRNMSDWGYADNTRHSRICLDCGDYTEYAPHTSGDGSCMHICEDCVEVIYDLDGEHRNISNWFLQNDTQHYRFCLDCSDPSTYEYADHTGGDGSCTPTCESCGLPYSDPNGQHNNMFDWQPYSDTQHARNCLDCSAYTEYGDHTGGTATCASGPICEVCGDEYGEPLSTHNGPFTEWTKATIDHHWRKCETCDEYEYGDHTGGTATCAATAVCDVCHEEYGFKSSTHTGNLSYEYLSVHHHYTTCDVCNQTFADRHTGGTATCESGPICDLCETAYGESLGGHDWGEWKSGGDDTHTRICKNDAAHTETADCSGGTATCVALAICEVCSAKYGEVDLTINGHDYRLDKEEHASCLETGLMHFICQREGCPDPVYEIVLEDVGQHLYHDWEPVGDGTHIDHCSACGEDMIVACTLFRMEGFAVCPICGVYDGGVLPVLIAQDNNDVLPIGTLVVRGGIPIEGMPFVITVTGSYAGEVVQLSKPVTVTIHTMQKGFTLVRVDMVDDVETRTEIPYTIEDGKLTFTAETVGLFLLVPAE